MTRSDLRLGMVGLGALGLPMAVNLHRAGFPLQVHTRSRDAERNPALLGCQGCATAAETAAFDQALKPRPIGLRRVVFHGHAAPRGVCSGPAYAGFMPQLLLHAEVIEFFKEISDL